MGTLKLRRFASATGTCGYVCLKRLIGRIIPFQRIGRGAGDVIARGFFRCVRRVLVAAALGSLLPAGASAAVSASLSQCGNLASGSPADCSWQNGNLNANQAHWLEGDSVPYQLVMSGLTPNASYTVTIGYDTTKGGKHAIDYLTSYDRTMAGGTPAMAPTNGAANPCFGVSGCTTPPNTFAVPQDPNVTSTGVTPVGGNFALFNGTITAVSGYSLSGSYTSDSQTNVTVTFTAGPANAGSKTNAVLAWGGHIATRADWGQGSGAVNITGSPYHTLLVSFSGGAGGSQDRALTATAIIFPATITVKKIAIPTGTTAFPFTVSPALPLDTGSVSSFSLVNSGSGSNSITYTLNTSTAFNVAYTFSEPAVPGWSLVGLSCTVDTVSGSTASTSGSTVTVTPQEAGVINCTYTNSEPTVAPPSFSPGTGVYSTTQTVVISSATQGASIRYTTDGSMPTETAGILYSGPVTVGISETVKGIAFESGMIDSAVSSATYTLPISVTVSPSSVSLYSNQTQQFTATVINTANTGVTWSVSPAGTGTISSTGLYTAPASVPTQQTVTVTATSQADSTKTASATVTLSPPVAVNVTPASATLYQGQTQQFTASVINTPNTAVTWSINPAGSGGIDVNGLYTAPAGVSTEQTVTVTATSQADSTKSSSATVTLSPPVAVSITPASATLYGGQTQQLSATVINTSNTGVSWSISPAGTGNISSTGLYTAPATISTQQTVTITATSQADSTKSASAVITLSPPVAITVAPQSATLYSGASQQFTATVVNSTNTAVTWTLSPSGAGTIDSTGLYTAPASIPDQQTVTLTATSQADAAKSATATVTLSPPIAVSISPTAATLYAGQTQQFMADVSNTSNTAVTWSISPATLGTIDITGLYTAPSTISTQQTVTITATSQANPSASVSAPVTLSPPACSFAGYSYARAITINHTKVVNSDQVNFPLLVSTTDPSLATVANGGHVTNGNGYDIAFSADAAGTHLLNYEIEAYNAATGEVIAWVNIPTLSHSSDTVLYILYGNSAISSSQQNSAGVWDSNYQAVYHFASAASLTDATANSSSGTGVNLAAGAGQIDGAASFNGSSSFAQIPSAVFGSYPSGFTASFGVWFKSSSGGGILGQTNGVAPNNNPGGFVPALYLDTAGKLRASMFWHGGTQVQIITAKTYNDNNWHLAYDTYANGVETLYVDGEAVGSQSKPEDSYSSVYSYFIGTADTGGGWSGANGSWFYFTGSLDEIEISKTARTSDWIATEYNNQDAPSSFYALSPENPIGVLPSSIVLYASQTEQFTGLNGCNFSPLGWSMSAGSPGVLTSGGLYTAPAPVSAEQAVTITAQNQADGSTVGSSVVTLMPPAVVSISPSTATIYSSGKTAQFAATVANAIDTRVAWSVSPAGAGSINSTGLYTAPQFTSAQTINIIATSQADPTESGSATVSLAPLIVSPNSLPIEAGFSQQFTASIPVTWSVNPSSAGTITTSGLFTAAMTSIYPQTATITATSTGDPSVSVNIHVAFQQLYGSITPTATTLSEGQSQQFTACVPTESSQSCGESGPVWTVSPAGSGSITSAGLYTAPAHITTAQTASVIATDEYNSAYSEVATVTLSPASVSVSPAAPTMFGGQQQQFSAAVANSTNTSVTWSITPATGAGVLTAAGLYTAPAEIGSASTVTITATSKYDPTLSGSATIALSPTQCAVSAYQYVRAIVIDHNQVPNTDLQNYPFLFSATDPALATMVNGGHVANSNGYDLLFSSDPQGNKKLDFEIEQYNPANGQVVAWVRIPMLSHSSDTVIYLLYGNSAITSQQQNPPGVWDFSYMGVYHLGNIQKGIVPDSTDNLNDGTGTALLTSQGQIDGGAAFNGSSSTIILPATDFPTYPISSSPTVPFTTTVSLWFKTAAAAELLSQGYYQQANIQGGNGVAAMYIDTAGLLHASLFDDGGQLVSGNKYNDNSWHNAVDTYDGQIERLYVDGQQVGWRLAAELYWASSYYYELGTGPGARFTTTGLATVPTYLNGALDEVEVSSRARSGDWVQAEYRNQASPARFFTLYPESGAGLNLAPATANLYGGQLQAFKAWQNGNCSSSTVVWSMPVGSLGTLSSDGIYLAPSAVNSEQTVTITATGLGNGGPTATAKVNLLPQVAVSLAPGAAVLTANRTQQFSATVSNTGNAGVIWTINPANAGTISASGLYTAPALISAQQTVIVTASSQTDQSQSASANILLNPSISMTVSPANQVLYAGQMQQFTVAVTGLSDPTVNWTVQPAGVGSITASGVYTAPGTVASQQAVTVTATSEADPNVTASTTVTLSPVVCAASGYSYERMIVIDHTKVANNDEINFPVLFDSTDPGFAATVNGGHVASSSGYDIAFSADPGGQTRLDYEIEEYDAATGHIIAWIRVPRLSHASDTTIYMLYGNPSVTVPQQNSTGVWDANYRGIWHVANGTNLSLQDSTSNANNGTNNGATATSGQIDGGMRTSGSTYATIGTPPTLNSLALGNATFSAWINPSAGSGRIMGKDDANGSQGWAVGLTSSNLVDVVVVFSGADLRLTSTAPLPAGQWSYVVVTLQGSSSEATATIYINGVPAGTGSGGSGQTNDDSAQPLYLANATYGDQASAPLNGVADEFRISNTIRSGDWIATEYKNQVSPSTFYTLYAENALSVSPPTAALYAGQIQQFLASTACVEDIAWSIPPDAPGSISINGLYTAPASIDSQQTVTVTATDQDNPNVTSNSLVTLYPAMSIAISPTSGTLMANQSEQFTAVVTNSPNSRVTWTISPQGLGSIDANGLYEAPTNVSAQQTVTITATAQEDVTKSASAMVTLAPGVCAAAGYGYQRAIVIDHHRVPNTDEINFPFLFNTTDPDFANVANGGHVVSPNGYDLIFSTDPAGQTKLDYEIEQYNPATGQVVAWIRIPTLSHTSDTVLYVFYGNSSLTASQQNPLGVWDNNFQAVYHLSNSGSGSSSDSTANGNTATNSSVTGAQGLMGGAASFNGASSFIQLPQYDFSNFPSGAYGDLGVTQNATTTSFAATIGMWFKTSNPGGLLNQKEGIDCKFYFFTCISSGPTAPGDSGVPGGPLGLLVGESGSLVGPAITNKAYNDNQWHYAVLTYANDGTDTLFVDGQVAGTSKGQLPVGYSATYAFFLGTDDTWLDQTGQGDWSWMYLNGSMDEVKISKIARSADWIQTEYNNQSSPSTFYTLSNVTTAQVIPSAISLYASEQQQFAVTGACAAAVNWTMPVGSAGSLTSEGLYTAPDSITGLQTVTVNASSSSTGTSIGSAVVTLQPPPPPISLSASATPPYITGSTQQFQVILQDGYGVPQVGVAVNFTILGPNASLGSATTDNSGTATYSYTGTTSGSDTIQASAILDGVVVASQTLTVTWTIPAQNPAGSLRLITQTGLGRGGLMGAFTDSTGALIEPVAIGATAREFIVPAGATQLQLGIDDTFYRDNGGPGFVVLVNGTASTLPATAMPWSWKTGGLNAKYQFGVGDGSAPVIARTGLSAGQVVQIAYQSGTVSTNYPSALATGADGDQSSITGIVSSFGTHYPTLFTSTSAYATGLPIPINVAVVDGAGNPVANTSVTLSVSGANPGEYQATTDSTGVAVFSYVGPNAGADTVQAQAIAADNTVLQSGSANINWITVPTPPAPPAKLTLQLQATVNNLQSYVANAQDTSTNPTTPISQVQVGFYVYGVDNLATMGTTDISGQTQTLYYHPDNGQYNVLAVGTVGGNVILSNVVSGTWTSQPYSSTGGSSNSISVSVSAPTTVSMPNLAQLTGTATDSVGVNPTYLWTEIGGPGTVTFATPQAVSTTASFSDPGVYVVEMTASDTGVSASAQATITVLPMQISSASQGPIGSPATGETLTGLVPISLASGVTLQSGILEYYPANNINSVTVLNSSTSGNGQLALLDTTSLANGSYWIQLNAIDTTGKTQTGLVLVTVAGNYKPGRVTATVTDLVVPSNGISINIQRRYDSLNTASSSDFGYGWSLGTNVNLTVDPKGNVTFTLGGVRRTFYLNPQYGGWLFPYYFVAFTPEPGFHGSLSDSFEGCPLDIVVPNGSLWSCVDGAGYYSPPGYIYTDPTGTSYTISANGDLQSVADKNGNGLTVSPTGITSSNGLNVPFVRDSQGRITQITDPQGNQYLYGYDDSGNLVSVKYPNTTQATSYTYAEGTHLYSGGTDFRSNTLPTTAYYGAADTDPNGLPLNGRLQSVTDALGETTSYAYDLSTNTTTITYPPDGTGAVGHATMVYDSYGMLLNSTDPLGNKTTNVYDTNHNLISTTDPMQQVTTYTYDQNGNRTSVTYPKTATSTNMTSTTQYNQYSEPTSTTDELGNVRNFAYDANYNPQSVKDSLGTLASFIFNANGTMAAGAVGYDLAQQPTMASQFAYDANGNMTSRTDALGRTTSYTYDSLGHKLTMVIPLPDSKTSSAAATTTYTYDALGNLTETDAPLGRTTKSEFDGNGNKTSDTDARNNKTTYAYDALNRLIETDYPDATSVKKSYDFRGNVIDEIDQAKNDTHYEYDLAGRQTSVTRAYGTTDAAKTSYTYDGDSRKLTETDPLNHTTTYSYDNAGNLLSVSGPRGNFQYGYDDARNRISMTDGKSNTTQYKYDARKRLTETDYPDKTNVKNEYDGPGNLTKVTDQASNVVQYTYDASNQLKTIVQVNSPNSGNNTNTYAYDPDGNLISLSDENSHTTQDAYNLLYQLTGKTLPDGSSSETRQYDTAGNLTSLKHFSGATTTFSYDSMNRLLTRMPDSSLNEPTESFTYTATGRRKTMTDASGETDYTYDDLDRLTQKASPQGTLNYTYDSAGSLASMTSADGIVSVSYSWDNLNRLSTVTDNRLGGGSNVTTYTYDTANNLATVTYPNTLQSTFQYDSMNRLTSMTAANTAYGYTLGLTGLRTQVLETSGRTVTWSFDGIYRLTGETVTGDQNYNGGVSYGLDPVGNRLSSNSTLHGINSGGFTYNADDELSGEMYDANGNVTATGGKTFAYDSQNRLTSMNGGAVRIVYDGDGNRVAKTSNGITTQYLVDDLNPTGYPQVLEEIVNGAPEREYTYGLQRIDEDQVIQGAWVPSFYGYDGFGTVRQLTNTAGAVTDTYEYDAFGNEITSTGTTANEFLYRGEQYDSDLGLYYLRARYYNAQSGRFMGRDPEDGKPIDPKALHKYLYVAGDPVNWIDPRGHGLISFSFSLRKVVAVATVLSLVGAEIYEVLECVAESFPNWNPKSAPSVDETKPGPCGPKYHEEWPTEPPDGNPLGPPRWPEEWE